MSGLAVYRQLDRPCPTFVGPSSSGSVAVDDAHVLLSVILPNQVPRFRFSVAYEYNHPGSPPLLQDTPEESHIHHRSSALAGDWHRSGRVPGDRLCSDTRTSTVSYPVVDCRLITRGGSARHRTSFYR